MYVYVGKLNYLEYAVNEMITIIIPRQFDTGKTICAYWQWTLHGDGIQREVNVTDYEGKIDRLERTGDEFTVEFFADKYYTFSGKLSADLKSMTLKMRAPTTQSTSEFMTMQLCYNSDGERSQTPLIYTGKLTYDGFATNEMIIFAVPNGFDIDEDICAFWQWTVDGKGEKNANVTDYKGHIERLQQYETGDTIECLTTHYYYFHGEVANDRDSMTLTMKSNTDQRISDPIKLQLCYKYVNRNKRFSVLSQTSVVKNDTDDAYYCTLSQYASPSPKGIILSVAGWVLNSAGFVAAVADFPIAIAADILLGATAVASASLADLLPDIPGNLHTKKLLFPNETLTRKSNTMTWGTGNQLTIDKYHFVSDVSNSRCRFVISHGTYGEKLESTERMLSDLLDKIQFEEIFSIDLPLGSTYSIESCTLLEITGLNPSQRGKKFSGMLPSKSMLTIKKTDQWNHGLWPDNKVNFTIDPERSFWYIENAKDMKSAQSKIVFLSENKYLLKMDKYKVVPAARIVHKNVRSFVKIKGESGALEIIKREASKYWAYSWVHDEGTLLCYKSDQVQEISKLEGITTYLWAQKSSYSQRIHQD